MRSRGEVGGARLAEDLADRIEQDRRRVRAPQGVDARPPPARGAGPCPLPRRTARRRRRGAGRAPTRAGRGRGSSARPRSWIRPGMLSDSGPSSIAGKERQDVDLEGHARRLGRSSGGSPGACPGLDALALGRARRRGRLAAGPGRRVRERGARRSSDSASTTISPRRGAKIRMNARTAGRSKLPNGPPSTDEHLGLADAIDVVDRAELGAVDAADRRADDLVPVVAAPGQVLVGADDRFEVGAAQPVRRVAVGRPRRSGSASRDRRRPASADAIVSGRSSPSRKRTRAATKRSSGRSVRTSTRTAP